MHSTRRVFLSFDQADAPWVLTFREALQSASLDVHPGPEWPQSINGAIDEADLLILIGTKHSSKSMWVRREIERALVSPNLKNRVVTVLVDTNIDLPWFLRTLPKVREDDPRRAARKVLTLLAKAAK